MADDDIVVVGAPLPRVTAVEARDALRIAVTWASDGPGAAVQVVDIAPAVFRYKVYAPLRDDPALFRTVRVTDDGFAVAWGDGLDMASTTLAELANQAMTPADFAAFMKRNGYTLDSVAAELGISRRLAASYAKDREIPRTVALACRYLDKGGSRPAMPGGEAAASRQAARAISGARSRRRA
jgi:lambda repressor-like predicted transcriptional regulator